MNLYLFHPEQFNSLYNCTNIQVEDVPLEARTHLIEGVVTIVLCAIFYILYIPCLISIYKHKRNSCYRLMLYIGIVDFLALWLLGFVQGYWSIIGAVYCTSPDLIYLAGVAVTTLWMTESTVQIILAVNRCISILSPYLEKGYLEAGLHYVLFTGIFFAWSFNPYVGYILDTKNIYVNYVHMVHDYSIAIGMPVIYLIFWISFVVQKKRMGSTDTKLTPKQKALFSQVVFIGVFHFVGCLLYAYLNIAVIHFAQFMWLFVHGMPTLIYLSMNETIKQDTRILLQKITCNKFSIWGKDVVVLMHYRDYWFYCGVLWNEIFRNFDARLRQGNEELKKVTESLQQKTDKVEDVPLEARTHLIEGVVTIVLCAIFYILYIPCLISIYKHKRNSCYRLMLYIGIVDFLALWLLGFVQGYWSIIGAVYCTSPDLIYLAGVAVTALWIAESTAEIILAINRCMSILSPSLEKYMFGGGSTIWWLLTPTIYGFYVAIFTNQFSLLAYFLPGHLTLMLGTFWTPKIFM
uniref:Uncharacterized protein n=1 Tax=Ditylenchus dipsaci TaxID=166011 RepID=A0A915DAA5_9BILA